MISKLRGQLIEKNPPMIVIDVNGVGYEILVSMQTFYALPAINEEIVVLIHQVIREDANLLFGFILAEERDTFRQLIKVSGVGAKTALGILSALNSQELAKAIVEKDIKSLSAAPGIGKKTAERLVLELRGKLTLEIDTTPNGALDIFNNNHNDIVNTLLALGYTDREAKLACKTLPENINVSEGVRLALKNMLK